MRERTTMRRDIRVLGVLASALVLAGCAAMPDSGTPPRLSTSVNDAQQVVVVAEPPKAGNSPEQLLSSFFDDLVSDESGYTTAKEFLSPNANKAWHPEKSATVVDGLKPMLMPTLSSSTKEVIRVTGNKVAALDARHAFSPVNNVPFQEDYTFTKGPSGWRIDTLPDGLVLKKEDFQRIYESVNVYYPIAGQSANGPQTPLVADPVFVRSHVDPLTEAANILLRGPSSWLAPAVQPGFPSGTALADSASAVQVSADGTASVRLKGQVSREPQNCARMAAQLFFTLAQVSTQQAKEAGQQIRQLSLYQGSDSTPSCSTTSDSPYAPTQSVTEQPIMYFVDSKGHLASLDAVHPTGPQQVTGLLAPAAVKSIGGFAVAPDLSGRVAVLSNDQKSLYVSTLTSTTAPTHPVTTDDNGFGSLSWDSLGTLWTVSDGQAGQGIGAVDGGTGKVVPVAVEGLKGRVTDAKVAADGARIALAVDNAGSISVQVGRIQRTTSGGTSELTIAGLHTIVPGDTLTSVTSLSWNDGDSIIVLGQQTTTGKAPSVWEIDGSSGVMPGLQAPSYADGMNSVSALQQDPSTLGTGVKAPYLRDASGSSDATERSKVYRWEKGVWEVLTNAGSSSSRGPMPSYPG
ncbi:hypothetical protein ABH941_002892 [Streptacidiphilus sp. EB103A]